MKNLGLKIALFLAGTNVVDKLHKSSPWRGEVMGVKASGSAGQSRGWRKVMSGAVREEALCMSLGAYHARGRRLRK